MDKLPGLCVSSFKSVADAEADSLCRSLCSLGHQLLVGTLQTFLIHGQGLKALHCQMQCLDTFGRPWN